MAIMFVNLKGQIDRNDEIIKMGNQEIQIVNNPMIYDENASVEKTSSIHTIAVHYIIMLNTKNKPERIANGDQCGQTLNIVILFGSHFAPFHSSTQPTSQIPKRDNLNNNFPSEYFGFIFLEWMADNQPIANSNAIQWLAFSIYLQYHPVQWMDHGSWHTE